MARPVTLFTGQWADLPLEELAAKCGELGLRRPRARLLGRPLRRRRGAARLPATPLGRRELLERHGLGCWAIGNHLVGQAVVRSDRRAPQGRAVPESLGRRRSRGRAPARRRGDEGHGARRGPARRRRRHRLHRLADLAHALLVPAQRLRRDRARLPGVRRALGADHRRVRGRGRALRARGAPHRDRLRLRHHAQGARRDRRPRRASASTSTRATSSTSSWTRRRSSPSSRTRSSTRTSRTRSAPRRPLLDPRRAPQLRRAGPRLGLRLPRPRRRRLRGR